MSKYIFSMTKTSTKRYSMLQVVAFSKYLNECWFVVISTYLVKVSVRTKKSES